MLAGVRIPSPAPFFLLYLSLLLQNKVVLAFLANPPTRTNFWVNSLLVKYFQKRININDVGAGSYSRAHKEESMIRFMCLNFNKVKLQLRYSW